MQLEVETTGFSMIFLLVIMYEKATIAPTITVIAEITNLRKC
jgi:hypothetical protein